jgi:hypothetical protein
MTIRDTEEHMVVNHAAGKMVGPMATVLSIRTEEPDGRLERLVDPVRRYCPVDSVMRGAVADDQVTWERL